MFILSVLFVLFSSYFFLSILDKKIKFKNNLGFIFFILLLFCQIIISFEFLSLFKLISKTSFIIINIVFFVISLFLWLKNERYIYIPNIKEEFIKIKKALKKDKLLMFVAFCFIVFFVSMLIVALFFPVKYGDALGYYLSRCTNWIQNGTLSHYITTDSRELIMPINSELTYMWVLLFLKNEIGIGIFPFIFYINAIYVIYNFLGELGFCRRKRLWSVFVFSSLALVYLESAIPISDLWVGSLLLTCIYLFFIAVKYNKSFLVYFSSLSIALAFGVKTTSIIATPSIFIILFLILYLYKKEKMKKYILYFGIFLFINFIIFSSYNYILNFVDFGNPISDSSQLLLNKFRGGIKGYLSNLIKYMFVMFDYSGVIDFIGIGKVIEGFQDKVLSIIGVSRNSYTSLYFTSYFSYNSALVIVNSFLGVVGLLTFYPSIIFAIYSYIKKKSSKRTILLVSLALSYIINILIFSRVMVFTKFNMRYLLAFVVIASPILVYTYIRKKFNIYKIVIAWFLFIYLAFNSHAQPFIFIKEYLKYKSLPANLQVKNRSFILEDCDEFRIRDYFLNKDRKYKIGIIIYPKKNPVYYIQKLRLDGYYMKTILPDEIDSSDISKYDYLITMKDSIASTDVKKINSNRNKNSYCVYKDWQGNVIKEGIPVIVSCIIPPEYFFKNGFELVNTIYLKDYYLFKNMKK